LKARVEDIQDRFFNLRNTALDALVDLINDIKMAKANGATDAQLATARDYHRRGQFMIDFVMSENSMGFHAPQEAMRILGDAINLCRLGQLRLHGGTRGARLLSCYHSHLGGRSKPACATTDLRLTRRLYVRPRYRLELVAEAFNVLNRDNKRVVITDDGFTSTATDFVQLDKTIGIRYFPAYYQKPTNLVSANSAYAPRQVQFALKLIF
jgi:hypothetical protein